MKRNPDPAAPKLLLPRDYIRDATRHIKKAKTRVSFISMVLSNDESTTRLVEALADASRRDVQVDVAADMFTYTELSGMFIPSHYYSKRVRGASNVSKILHDAGAHFHWLGRISTTTYTGRTHAKWCVVDDTVYSFGGVNPYGAGVANTDYMFKVEDPELATRLIDEHRKFVREDKGRFASRSRSFDIESGIVRIDSGLYGDSVIYRRACTLAHQAASITLVSQYCPTGKLSKILKRKDARLYFNDGRGTSINNKIIIRIGMLLSGQRSLYARANYLHAKFILFTMPDGSKAALTGSHNFVHSSGLLGTREIALETRDPGIIAQLEDFFAAYVA